MSSKTFTDSLKDLCYTNIILYCTTTSVWKIPQFSGWAFYLQNYLLMGARKCEWRWQKLWTISHLLEQFSITWHGWENATSLTTYTWVEFQKVKNTFIGVFVGEQVRKVRSTISYIFWRNICNESKHKIFKKKLNLCLNIKWRGKLPIQFNFLGCCCKFWV
jgi:hypothetical protein